MAGWDWKTQLPQTYPENVLDGKVAGDDAVLMEVRHDRDVHCPNAFQPFSELDELAQELLELTRLATAFTGPLHKRAIARLAYSRANSKRR